MTINSTKIGPGVLTIAATAFAAQCSSADITPTENVDSTDKVDVLSGETLAAADTATYSYVFNATFLQDMGQSTAAGIVGYSWANAGQTKSIVYTPSNAAAAGTKTWTMNVRIVPLKVGGPVQAQAPTSDVTWQIIGTPVMT